MGLPRKKNYNGRWDVLIDKATRCLNRLIEIAARKKRHYIIDQVRRVLFVWFFFVRLTHKMFLSCQICFKDSIDMEVESVYRKKVSFSCVVSNNVILVCSHSCGCCTSL